MTYFKKALAVSALFPTFALAQAVPSEPYDGAIMTGDLKRNNIVVTATGADELPENTGQAITIIDRSTIDQRQTVNITDLLSTVPGVTVSRNGGPGQVAAVRIRGAEDAQTLVLVDGVRVNDPSSPAGSFDFGNLIAGNIERIEVLRGANSVPWGSQALGGIVNISTAPPTDAFKAQARAEYGSHEAAQIAGNASGKVGPVALSAGGGWYRDGGVSAYRFGTERDGYRQWALTGRAQVELSSDVKLDLRANYADSRVEFDGFPPPNFAFADTNGFGTSKQFFGYGGLNAALGGISNRVAFTFADTRRASYTTAISAPSLFTGRSERFEYQGDARPADWLRLVFGAEHETTRAAGVSTGVTSGYLQTVLTPLDGLTLTGGIRVDDHRDYGTKATFGANAAWQIGSGTILRATYAEGFKAPTLFQLKDPIYGKPDLRPETARSYDFGIEQKLFDGRATLSATVFHRNAVDQINFDLFFFRYNNIDLARATGVELGATLKPSDRLTLTTSLTATDSKGKARNEATFKRLYRRPVLAVNANIDWQAPFGLKLGAGVQSISDADDADYRTFLRTSLDGYTLVTLRAAMPIGERLEVYGRIENAFNTAYETVSGYGTYGRNAHIGVRVKL